MRTFIITLLAACGFAAAQTSQPFDGRPWNLSTGNLSTYFIQASPVGAFPRPNVLEPPPPLETLKELKHQGLVAYEDYVAWGAIEREPEKWDWAQHDAVERTVHEAGLKYVVYNWVHFPPTWLRDERKSERTLMKCLEHGQETNYLSIFDPKTIEHYDHFYRNLKEHFGEKIDAVYACILGPYGEGNYPLNVPDWIKIGHCHEGYWCADDFAGKAFARPMPAIDAKFKPHPDAFTTAEQRRAWLDFITWYHQAIVDFTEKSIQTTLKYFPPEKVRTKPGGNAGGVNPLAWGTYCPAYAKMAAKYKIVLQPADWHGAYFGDKWVATAYHFYGVTLGTEPAGGLDDRGFVKRLFSDISCGTRQLFTYEFEKHAAAIQKYAHLITGQPGDVQLSVLCPTTLYRLGADLSPTIKHANALRDIVDYDVLDELLIADGALKADKYKALLIFQGDFIDQPILDKFADYLKDGGTILLAGKDPIRNVEGVRFKPGSKLHNVAGKMFERLEKLAPSLGITIDPRDGVWTTRRGTQAIHFNGTDRAITVGGVDVAPHSIAAASTQPHIGLAPDSKSFTNGFIPWGFNYDRDHKLRLLEEIWDSEWPTVEQDFREMKALGANVVRIHLQFGRFMDAPDRPNKANLARLKRLVRFAEQIGILLDITGLASYRKGDVPDWYNTPDEAKRWEMQANFWSAIAETCKDSPAVFCYDLMNEPVVPGKKTDNWLVPFELAGFSYLQHIALDPANRDRMQIARDWTAKMIAAIRKHDQHHMITLGLLPVSADLAAALAPQLDFLSVHIYPEAGKVDEAIATLKRFDFGKPIVIEETFPMNTGVDEFRDFLQRARPTAAGVIGFYWGKSPDELKSSADITDRQMLLWLELFDELRP